MTALQLFGLVLAALAAALHVVFFVLESVLFRLPVGRRLFGIRAEQHSAPLRLFAVNQGIYNLSLAVVVLVGVVLLALDPGAVAVAGTTVVVTGCAVMTVAGVALAFTGPPRMLPIALAQGVPPLVAIVALVAGG